MSDKLTVIIPFLNEGVEVENTLRSIRETAGGNVAILLINDASQDAIDYKAVADRYQARYYCNIKRMGVAASRDFGVNRIETEYFLIVDAHMRFNRDDWWKQITEALQVNERALYCTSCIALDEYGEPVKDQVSMGAYLQWCDVETKTILTPEWNLVDRSPDSPTMEIPCVLGACYAASKKYWNYLKGLQGLEMYGLDEPYISLKIWLEGGNCVLIKTVGIGHIFRTRFPYEVRSRELLYNKLLMIETLLPAGESQRIYNYLRRFNATLLRDAMEKIQDNRPLVNDLKKYYRTIFTRNIEDYKRWNARFIEWNR